MPLIIAIVVLLAFAILIKALPIRQVTIYEFQKGLKYSRGRYTGTLDPGQYWIISTFAAITAVDNRSEFVAVQGQDVLSADGVTLKVSVAAEFQVADPHVAVNNNANYRSSLYMNLQMALREIIGKEKIDTVLENRSSISARLMELTSAKAAQLGVKLIAADVKDIMLPGDMKKVFAQVVKAQKEGQAALERARGETAALRNLANAARTMDDNPNLLQLRALQALADSSGSTLVFGVPNGAFPLGRSDSSSNPSTREQE